MAEAINEMERRLAESNPHAGPNAKTEDFKDLDVLSATFAITHLYSGFNPNHHVIVRAHESYTDPPAPVIDSINNRQLRQSGGTRYLKVSRTVLDKEKQ